MTVPPPSRPPAPEGTREHRWPARALMGDYLRAGAGLAVCAPPLFFIAPTPSVVVVLGGLSALFAWLALRTAARQLARVRIGPAGLARGGRVIPWARVTRVRLRRFGARRADGGMMEMTVAGAGTRIGVDSAISDFPTLARRVHAEARASGAAMDDETRAAFAALGLGIGL